MSKSNKIPLMGENINCLDEAWIRFEGLEKSCQTLHVGEGFLAPISYGRKSQISFLTDDEAANFNQLCYPGLIRLLNEKGWETPSLMDRAQKNLNTILGYGLGLHNHLPDAPTDLLKGKRKILILDQPLSEVKEQGEDVRQLTKNMLSEAQANNHGANFYLAQSLSSTFKPKGYLFKSAAGTTAEYISLIYNPISLIKQADLVYTINSLWGFYALLLGKKVHCWGQPFYAGWGLTCDWQKIEERQLARTPLELFAASFMLYSRYKNPITAAADDLGYIIEILQRQRQKELENSRPTACYNFQRYKHSTIRSFLNSKRSQVKFFSSWDKAQHWAQKHQGRLVSWSSRTGRPKEQNPSLPLVLMEDGFLRSRGLGSAYYAPYSLSLDDLGIYYNPQQPSRLETILATYDFAKNPDLLLRAQKIKAFMVEYNLTKYNVGITDFKLSVPAGRRVVLVPGQVEDDASIKTGAAKITSNLALLQEVRKLRPDAFIIYKSHPDVEISNRVGAISEADIFKYADHLERQANMAIILRQCHEVHTITSLSGFEALLHGLEVYTYGMPFYAGWGLTYDQCQNERRGRQLSLDELVAAALILYPSYYDWQQAQFCGPEEIIWRLKNSHATKKNWGGMLFHLGMRIFYKLPLPLRNFLLNLKKH